MRAMSGTGPCRGALPDAPAADAMMPAVAQMVQPAIPINAVWQIDDARVSVIDRRGRGRPAVTVEEAVVCGGDEPSRLS
ncbi:MAG: hypothetical protein QGD94_10230, partial [Planctomycetia bacterium]|nr:hypothetical protein [Planctomycetia bacterium]